MKPAKAFELIRDECWRGTRPLIPLFGAGISVDAGIPLLSPILEYLVRVVVHISLSSKGVAPSTPCAIRDFPLHRESKPYHSWITERGWPDRHDLTEIQLGQFDALTISKLRSIVVDQLGIQEGPGLWRTILDRLTNSDSALVDRFFSKLIRHARPSAAHQYAAFLAHIMNIKLILTTNFDPLLERALLDQDLEVINYELTNSEHWPDAKLVASQRAIIQMHGGTFALLAGAILDVPLDERRKRIFLDYIDPRALMLVVGYGGLDKRVRNIIEDHAARGAGTDSPQVLWLHRPVKAPHEVKGIEYVNYHDGAHFLRELHDRLTTSHPVSRLWYSALNHVPPRQVDPKGQSAFGNGRPWEYVIYNREVDDFGTSSALAQHVQETDIDYDVIWCHLESLPTIDSFIAFLQREFRRRDPAFPPFAMFRSLVPRDDHLPPTSRTDWRTDPRPQYILRAMRRGKYLIAIDSLGEFGDHVSPGMTSDQDNNVPASAGQEEYKDMIGLLEHLISKYGEFGESRLVIGASPKGEFIWPEPSSQEEYRALNVRSLSVVPPIDVSKKDNPGCFKNDAAWERIKAQLDEWKEKFGGWKAALQRRKNVREIVEVLFNSLSKRAQAVLAVAIAFRHFRSIVALRQILIPLWEELDKGILALENVIRTPQPISGPRRERTKALDELLDGISAFALIVRQEGGFYWMHRVVRGALYDRCRALLPDAFEDLQVTLHDRLATYYRTLFAASHDRTTLVEYLYHRFKTLESIGKFRNVNEEVDGVLSRLRDLDTTLAIERDHLLSQRYSDTLLAWVESFRQLLAEHIGLQLKMISKPADRAACQQVEIHLMATLCDLKAEALRQKHDLFRCLAARFEQIGHRLQFSEKLTKPTAPRKKPARAGGAEDPGYWNDLWKRFEETHAWTHNSSELKSEVRKVLTSVCKDGVVARWCATTASPRNSVDASINGYRLLEELIDVAYCASGLDIQGGRQGVSVKRELPFVLLSQIHEELEGISHTSEGPHSYYEHNRARRILIRCCYRRMEHVLRPLTLWNRDDKDLYADERKEVARQMYDRGMKHLCAFSGVELHDFLHYACFLNTLMARAYYLDRDFVAAFRYLDQAEAAVSLPTTGSERSALAVSRLHRAECRICDADYQFSEQHPDNKNDPIQDSRRSIGRASVGLELAQSAIEQARDLLDQGRPHVQWWSKSYWLEAQCCHEHLVLWFLQHVCLWREVDDPLLAKSEAERHEEWRGRLQEFDDLLRRALTCVRLSRDTARQDDQRAYGTVVLAQQLYVCRQLFVDLLRAKNSKCRNAANRVFGDCVDKVRKQLQGNDATRDVTRDALERLGEGDSGSVVKDRADECGLKSWDDQKRRIDDRLGNDFTDPEKIAKLLPVFKQRMRLLEVVQRECIRSAHAALDRQAKRLGRP
ncbi:MAG: SIR2 family protein [Planctomycetota bacterium]